MRARCSHAEAAPFEFYQKFAPQSDLYNSALLFPAVGFTAASVPSLSSQASDLTLRDCDISSSSGALLPGNTPRAPDFTQIRQVKFDFDSGPAGAS